MNWQEGQKVECEGLDWGPCYVTMSNQHMVVIYCPRYELVTTASPIQLEQAGWKVAHPTKVVWLQHWKQADRRRPNPVPGV
jgi:hypothetical protein